MSKRFKATLSMFLCAVMVLCSVAVGGMFANADTNTSKAIQLVKDGTAANITGGQASPHFFLQDRFHRKELKNHQIPCLFLHFQEF